MMHHLKIHQEYFKDILSGVKTFEIRKNDRDFKEGDFLLLNEYDRFGEVYTESTCTLIITYTSTYEQKDDYIVLGVKVLSVDV